MSVKIMSKVWEQSRAKGTARLVLLAIADHCNPGGVAWPSLTRLASYVNVNRRNTINAINQLVELGELERLNSGKTGRATTYKVTLGSVSSDTGVSSDTSVSSDTQVVSVETPQPSMNRHKCYIGNSKFDDFWSQYPKKVGKGAARNSYKRAIKKTPHETIMAGLAKYDPDPNYICNPTTWLNQERWTDEHTGNHTAKSKSGRRNNGELTSAFARFENRRKTNI
tara:strand:- start:848 stop:1519 length:672 start_codon:yes stop_codon:yes gene_type:complete